MMQVDGRAFILKQYAPKRNVIAVLDRTLGHVVASTYATPMSVGTLIGYRLRQQARCATIEQIEILHVPFELAQYNILFLHHMLEICYYFIPEGSTAPRVYDLLLYVVTEPPICARRQKNILFLLFSLLGMYPDDVVICRDYAQALHHESFQTILSMHIDSSIEPHMSSWLYRCVMMHACARNFKTLHYLHEK